MGRRSWRRVVEFCFEEGGWLGQLRNYSDVEGGLMLGVIVGWGNNEQEYQQLDRIA